MPTNYALIRGREWITTSIHATPKLSLNPADAFLYDDLDNAIAATKLFSWCHGISTHIRAHPV